MGLRAVFFVLFLPSLALAEPLNIDCRAAPSFDLNITITDATCRLNELSGTVEDAEGSRRCVISETEEITITPDLIFRYTPPDGRPAIWGRCAEKGNG